MSAISVSERESEEVDLVQKAVWLTNSVSLLWWLYYFLNTAITLGFMVHLFVLTLWDRLSEAGFQPLCDNFLFLPDQTFREER